MPSAGIYIHIPFCNIKCIYCDFYSVVDQEKTIPKFFRALFNEIKSCNTDTSEWQIDTIFIGGGTPSLIEPNLISKLIEELSMKFNLSDVKEFTIEANPGEAKFEYLKEYNDLGINRLSIGVQSLEPKLLEFLTRIHNPSDVFHTFDNARKAGFKNINCDLIFNIPNQSIDTWKRDLQKIIDLDPEHISCYSLTVEGNTQLFQYVKNGKVKMPNQDTNIDYYKLAQLILAKENFNQYEISNWSKPGKECQHNLHYWKIDPYLSFGPSAHSFDGKKRYSNMRNLNQYIKSIEKGDDSRDFSEKVTEKNYTNELIGFGLRIVHGIDLQKIPSSYRQSVNESIKLNHEKWGNHFRLEENKLKLTKEGFAFSDSIAIDLMI